MRCTYWLSSAVLAAALTSVGCTGAKLGYNLPPAQQIMEPGPGVGGPGPGVIPVPGQMGVGASMATQASYVEDAGGYPMQGDCYGGGGCPVGGGCMGMPGMSMPTTSQISFLGEQPLTISWDVSGHCLFDSQPLFVPDKQDFGQGQIYRLKVANLPGRETVVLYPTLEVAPVTPRTDAYLAHAPVPVQFTEEDFDQVLSGNFVTKVIYLPDPEFTEVALAGVETLVSTRLDPGVDPIAEADRRGSILAILRMGNKDLKCDNSAPVEGSIMPAQYDGQEIMVGPEHYPAEMSNEYMGPSAGPGCPTGDCMQDGTMGYGPGLASMPMGAPTAGMTPNMVPPHMVPNMAPAYGMPMSGTPIGLPGPPHIPHGIPAGLKRHTMTNRTRMVMPGPTKHMDVVVKQRPGMNYPAPVNKIRIDEVNRAPAQAFGGTVPGIIPSALNKAAAKLRSLHQDANCETGACQY